jgi:hypothetical protein
LTVTPQDKAVFRLAIGLGLAVLVAYGFAMSLPFVACVMTVLVVSKPGPPQSFAKGAIGALVLAVLLGAGMLMVPLLEHYAAGGVLLTALIFYFVMERGLLRSSPLTMLLVMAFVLMPVAGVAEQALVGVLTLALATGIVLGTLVNLLSHGLFPDPPRPAGQRPEARTVTLDQARWTALRATVIVMPVFVLALTDPSTYLAAIMKTVTLGQQAGDTDARNAGRELVGSTFAAAAMALVAWLGLSMLPKLWMLTLWMTAMAFWAGMRLYGLRRSKVRPSFWANALITALILLGPAIEDSANGKSVLAASAMRTTLFLLVAFYAWAAIWLLERLRLRSSRTATTNRPSETTA